MRELWKEREEEMSRVQTHGNKTKQQETDERGIKLKIGVEIRREEERKKKIE